MKKVNKIQQKMARLQRCPQCGAPSYPEIGSIEIWLEYFKKIGLPICRKTFDVQIRPHLMEAKLGNKVVFRGADVMKYFNEQLRWW